jgi:hypothetical protein
MGNWLNAQLNQLGVETKLVDLGTHEMQGQTLQLPPAIMGRLGSDPAKKTVLVYGHYDVQPVSSFCKPTSGGCNGLLRSRGKFKGLEDGRVEDGPVHACGGGGFGALDRSWING